MSGVAEVSMLLTTQGAVWFLSGVEYFVKKWKEKMDFIFDL